MIRVRDTELLQENVIGLIQFAHKHEFVNLDGDSPSPFVADFVNIVKEGCTRRLTRQELETLVGGVQAFVRLPVYTTDQAAAWLGVGIDTIRDAVWRSRKLETFKPGHDRLVLHRSLVKYQGTERGEALDTTDN